MALFGGRWSKRISSHADAGIRQLRNLGGKRGAYVQLFEISDLLLFPRTENQAIVRALCRNAYAGEGVTLTRVLGRYKMYVDAQDVGISSHLMLDGFWEMWITEAMVRLIKPGMVVADVGANVGYFTVLMGELVGPEGRVHAFEPNPPIAELLRRNVLLGPGAAHTTVHELAVGDHEGEARLFAPAAFPGGASIMGQAQDRTVTVPLKRLDALAELDRLDFVKIDVEGAEEVAWRGLQGLLPRNPALKVFMEFAAVRYADPAAFIDELLGQGFSLSLIDYDGHAAPLEKAALLALPPHQDVMLFLQRA